jgi:hypothetical protein
MYVLLGYVGNAVGGGGPEVPGVEGSDDFLVHLGTERLKDASLGHVTLDVDRDLHDYVTLDPGRQRGTRYVGTNNGQGRFPDETDSWAVGQGPLLRTSLQRIRDRVGVLGLPDFVRRRLPMDGTIRYGVFAQRKRRRVDKLGNNCPAPKPDVRRLDDSGVERSQDQYKQEQPVRGPREEGGSPSALACALWLGEQVNSPKTL